MMYKVIMCDANDSQNWIPDADWKTIDHAIVTLSRKKGELDVEMGRWLLAAQREHVDRHLGYGSFVEYVERRLGYDRRTTREKIRVARTLDKLPRIRELLRSGERTWSATREIVRVATPETEGAWIERTERSTVREIENMVAGRKPGERPNDEKDPLIFLRRLVFDLPPEVFALVQEAFEKMRKEIGSSASNVDALRAMAEAILGARPDAKASYQATITLCASCDRAWQQAGGDVVEVSSAQGDCARCDGDLVGFTRIDEGVAEIESDAATHVGLEPEIDDPETQELRRVVGARMMLRTASRLFGVPLKSMTPRLRAAVRARDGGRCVVPGCTHFRHVDLHHHQPRAKGGPNTAENIYSLCTRHHRAVHDGVLAIEGSPSTGLCFRQADGELYGAPLRFEVHDACTRDAA